MNTVVSGRGGRGGLLVMLDRCNRRHVVERVSHVNQDEVVRAVGRMKARKALPVVRSVTTGNGGTFPGQKRLDRAFGAESYDTRAYASCEKGAARKTSTREGVPMGSGAMESQCSQNRFRRRGQFWSKAGFAPLLFAPLLEDDVWHTNDALKRLCRRTA